MNWPFAPTLAITFTLSGFSAVKREEIEISAGFTAAVNVDLRVGSIDGKRDERCANEHRAEGSRRRKSC